MRIFLATLSLLLLSLACNIGDSLQKDTPPINTTDLQRLVTFLKNQNPDKVRPVKDYEKTVTVNVALGARRISLDDAKEEMSLDAWSFMSWHDEYLEWTPSDYAGIETVSLWSSDIWLPDLTVYNRVGGTNTPLFVEVTVVVSSNGEVIWFPETHVKVPCTMDLKRWPSDRHNCSVNLGSWAHDASQLTVAKSPGQEDMIVEDYSPSTDWRLVNHSTWRRLVEVSGTPHSDLRFSFVMQRVAADKASYIISSSFVVIVCLLSSYFVPATQLTARLLLHLFAISGLIGGDLVLFLSLPTNGGALPHVVRYYTGSLFLATLSLLCTLWLYALTRPSPTVLDRISRIAHSRKVVGTYSHLSNFEAEPSTQAQQTTNNEIHLGMETSPSQPPSDQVGGSCDSSGRTTTNSASETRLSLEQSKQERRHRQKMTMVKVVNGIAFIAFAAAFLIDYLVLRSYVTG